MKYYSKHFEGFDVMTDDTGRSFIVSETDPENKPQIGPFNRPSEAIEFGLNRVEKIR